MNPTKLSLALGRAVREARLDLGLSQADFAKATRISQPHISKLEAGERMPEYKTLRRLARVLGGEQTARLLTL